MLETQTFNLRIPITTWARQHAKEFAAEQVTAAKKTRVYLNTLAVGAVNNYLQILEIETDLEASDSWHPAMRKFHDVADLVIPNLGTLECRPVLPNEKQITLPPEAMEERIGYLFVRFNDELTEAELLGFLPIFDPEEAPEEIAINDLQPLESLFDCLARLEIANNFWLTGEDEIFRRVNERLEVESRENLIAKLEWIFRTKEIYDRPFAAKELLKSYLEGPAKYAETSQGSVRENLGGESDIELSDLAEDLMDKLAEIWEE